MVLFSRSPQHAAVRFILGARFQKLRRFERLGQQIAMVAGIGGLVHELQKERGMSNLFLASGGRDFIDQRRRQAMECQKFAQVVLESFAALDRLAEPPRLLAVVATAGQALAGLPALRQRVENLAVAPAEAAESFSALIGQLLAVIVDAADIAADQGAARALIAYVNLLQGKEWAGQERAVVAAALTAGRFTAAQHRRLFRLIASQNRCFEVFGAHAEPEQRQAFAAALAGTVGDDVAGFRVLAEQQGLNGDLSSAAPADWFAAATRRIDALKAVEDRLAADLRMVVATRQAAALQAFDAWPTTGAGVFLRLAAWRTRRRLRRDDDWLRRVGAAASALLPAAGTGILPAELADVLADEWRRQASGGAVAEQQARERANEEQRQQALESAVHGFSAALDAALADMMAVSQQVNVAARRLSEVASATDHRTEAMADTADESRRGAHSVAAAAESMAGGVQEIHQEADRSLVAAQQALAETGRVQTTVDRLSSAASRIDDVMKLINAIASQTNLLALNATIEAARAGEAGRGFAVVAGEVKALANQTTTASEEISRQIDEMRGSAAAAVAAIGAIRQVVAGVDESAARIAGALAQQDLATARIAAGIQQVAAGAEVVGAAVSGVRTSATETGVMARGNLDSSERLAMLVDGLRGELDAFLTRLKAA